VSARRTVLIVDDDDSVRALLRITLPDEDFLVVEAEDGDLAMQRIGDLKPDLVLLDWKMPGRHGALVLDDVRQHYPELPVIVLTSEHREPQRELARSLGANVFLTKPFSPVEVIETVERLLGRSEQGPRDQAT
jgi:two-component system phosphate regulon response regulator PhoB